MNKSLYFLLVLTLLLGSSCAAAEPQWMDRIVAIAGQDIITERELKQELQAIVRELKARETKLPAKEVLIPQVLERLIVKKLQLERASSQGIRIDDISLDRAVEKIAAENTMSLPQFRKALTEEGLNYADFREDIRHELTISKLRKRQVDGRINVSDQEISDLIENSRKAGEVNKRYRLSHILIALPGAATPDNIEKARLEAAEVLLKARSGEDFSALAIAHSDGQQALKGGDLGWRSGDQLPAQFAKEIVKLKPQEVSQLIRSASGFHILKLMEIAGGEGKPKIQQSRSRHILVTDKKGQVLLKKLRQKIIDGADFAALAKKYSKDPGSAVKGGDLGWTSPGTFVPAFDEALAGLSPGQISEPFKSRFGWHIVQLQEQRTTDIPDDLLQARARELIMKQKREEETELWLRRLRDESYVEYRLPGMKPTG
ncbi:MAG: molecular chaperone SurA [Thiothrix sp.]|nr:MAG: molecular chaperone SurA [Thiothrix sp.]